MEWSIQEVARLAGTTSRALRHYDAVGLVPPSRVGTNGYRYYDADALVRLQRVLLLRGLGLGIPAIAGVLEGRRDDLEALRIHLALLREERDRLDRRIASVESTIRALEGGETPMAHDMFDGFDHTRYRDEVERRWGKDAYARSDAWWRGLGPAERREWQEATARLGADWQDAAARGIDPAGEEAQRLAARHVEWLHGMPGTPGHDGPGPAKEYVLSLGDMYVADPRFAANYGGEAGATLVRDALRLYAERELA